MRVSDGSSDVCSSDLCSRLGFLTKGALAGAAAAAGTTLAAPAIAQELPTVRWRLTSGFPNNLDTIYGGAVVMAEALSKIPEGKFQIQVFQAGELIPGPQAIAAVQTKPAETATTSGNDLTAK